MLSYGLYLASMDTLFQIILLIMSVVVHEVSHGYAAYILGDPTAKNEGRLTLNPLKHLDIFGSVILPILLVITKAGFVFGWAKPVPYNPYNFQRGGKWGEAIVAGAGPLSNIVIAVFFGLIIRFAVPAGLLSTDVITISALLVFINILLAVFNLVPIAPLDGSKILFAFLPYHMHKVRNFLEMYGFFLVLIFIFFLWPVLSPIIGLIFWLITGFSL